MDSQQQIHFNQLYQIHPNHLTLQGKRPATINAYARAVRRLGAFYDFYIKQSPYFLNICSLIFVLSTKDVSTEDTPTKGNQYYFE